MSARERIKCVCVCVGMCVRGIEMEDEGWMEGENKVFCVRVCVCVVWCVCVNLCVRGIGSSRNGENENVRV